MTKFGHFSICLNVLLTNETKLLFLETFQRCLLFIVHPHWKIIYLAPLTVQALIACIKVKGACKYCTIAPLVSHNILPGLNKKAQHRGWLHSQVRWHYSMTSQQIAFPVKILNLVYLILRNKSSGTQTHRNEAKWVCEVCSGSIFHFSSFHPKWAVNFFKSSPLLLSPSKKFHKIKSRFSTHTHTRSVNTHTRAHTHRRTGWVTCSRHCDAGCVGWVCTRTQTFIL